MAVACSPLHPPGTPLKKAKRAPKKSAEEVQAAKAAKQAAKEAKQAAKDAKAEAKAEAKAAKEEAKAAKEAAKEAKEAGPKKAVSAYFHFMVAERANVQAANPEAKGAAAIGKLLGEAWKALDEEGKAKFEQLATEDKERYEAECAAAGIEVKKPKEKAPPKEKPPPKEKAKLGKAIAKGGKGKKKGKPPKPAKSAKELYFKDHLYRVGEELKSGGPDGEEREDVSTDEIHAELEKQFAALDEAGAAEYAAKAAADLERFESELAGKPVKKKPEAAAVEADEEAAAAEEDEEAAAPEEEE